MIRHSALSAAMLVITSLVLLNTGLVETARADKTEAASTHQAVAGRMYGKVTEVIDAAGYTYAEVDTGKEKVWAAGPVSPLKAGDAVSFSTSMPMVNFHSRSLERDFSVLYFTDTFMTEEGAPINAAADPVSPGARTSSPPVAEPVKGIDKLEGGNTIAEILGDKENLEGKMLRVRGQVTKFNPGIMGRNWLHIVDSSSTGDLTVTTDSTVAVDDIVIVEGTLQLDKDFGYGYTYPLIVEEAQVSKE